MPEMYYFRVTQTRELEVFAPSMREAIDIGREVFGKESLKIPDKIEHITGRPTSRVKIKRLEADEI